MNSMQRLIILLSVPLFSACNNDEHKNEKAKVIDTNIPVEHIEPTADQKARREQSEAVCKAHNVPIYSNPNSLFVTSETQTTLRNQDEVAKRALALCYIGLKSEGLEKRILDQVDSAYHISPNFTPKEKEYVDAVAPTKQQVVDANWRYECLHVMLWALGYVDQLSYPAKPCDVAADNKIIHELANDANFKQKAKLRSKKEILDQADLILRLDWACVNARVKGQPMPGGLNNDVVTERHHALNWLISYANQDWDDVSTDT